jgi:hypothetical protein
VVTDVFRAPAVPASTPLHDRVVRLAAAVSRIKGEVRLQAVRPAAGMQGPANAVPGSRSWSPPD